MPGTTVEAREIPRPMPATLPRSEGSDVHPGRAAGGYGEPALRAGAGSWRAGDDRLLAATLSGQDGDGQSRAGRPQATSHGVLADELPLLVGRRQKHPELVAALPDLQHRD
ncbi:hypothetical protein SHIRM173S_12224 [Streptomyces hirsutus]